MSTLTYNKFIKKVTSGGVVAIFYDKDGNTQATSTDISYHDGAESDVNEYLEFALDNGDVIQSPNLAGEYFNGKLCEVYYIGDKASFGTEEMGIKFFELKPIKCEEG
jgi:hypothetical protein